MSRIFLAPYSIRLKKHYQKEYSNFGDVFKSKSMLDIVQDFLLSLQSKFTDNEEDSSILRISKVNKDRFHHTLNGIVETGEYGYESKFYHRTSGDLTYNRQIDHAEVMPFYFLIGINDKMDIGLIILQRFGQYGISKVFLKGLKAYIKELAKDYTVEIEPVISDSVLQKLVRQGEIKRVIFNKYDIPSDLASAFSKKGKENTGYLQLSLVSKRNSKLNLNDRLNSLLYGNGTVKKLVILKDFDYDETKVVIQDGNNKRTVTLGDNRFKAHYEITKDIIRGKDNHPTFDSLDSQGKSLMTELFKLVVK